MTALDFAALGFALFGTFCLAFSFSALVLSSMIDRGGEP